MYAKYAKKLPHNLVDPKSRFQFCSLSCYHVLVMLLARRVASFLSLSLCSFFAFFSAPLCYVAVHVRL